MLTEVAKWECKLWSNAKQTRMCYTEIIFIFTVLESSILFEYSFFQFSFQKFS